MFNSKDKILIIAAHPDDEVIGCGGTILKAKALGSKVSVIFLGEGVSTRFPNHELGAKSLKAKKIRENESKKCLKILGIKDYKFGSLLCTSFDDYPLLKIVRIIESKINDFKPSIIFTHNENEINIDHTITHKAVEIACRYLKGDYLKSIYSFEVICSANLRFKNKFYPNVYVNIKKYWKKKIFAFKAYKTEIRKYPHPRSIRGLEILAKYRGLQSNQEYSEAFKLEKSFVRN